MISNENAVRRHQNRQRVPRALTAHTSEQRGARIVTLRQRLGHGSEAHIRAPTDGIPVNDLRTLVPEFVKGGQDQDLRRPRRRSGGGAVEQHERSVVALPCRNASLLCVLSLCLSRACLGKKERDHFSTNWHRKKTPRFPYRSRTPPSSHPSSGKEFRIRCHHDRPHRRTSRRSK